MAEARGRSLAERRTPAIRARAEQLRQRNGRPATLAVLATDEPAELRFAAIKQRTFRAAGLDLVTRAVSRHAGTAAVLEQVAELNADPAVDGLFLQFPLPLGVEPQRCADAVLPERDVDASGSVNLGLLLAGRARYVPAAASAVLALLEDAVGPLRGRSIIVAGEAHVTERSLVVLGVERGATLCILAPDDPALPDAAAGADAVVVTGTLPPGDAFLHARSGTVLLDAGYFLPPRPREWLPPRVAAQLGLYLPQYANVGPLTVSWLMDSVLTASARS